MMADDWDMPLGADARSFSSRQCKYDTWDDDYESIHKTGNSTQNATKSFHNTNDSESDGWMSAKSKSSKAQQSARSSWKDDKQELSKGKRNYSKHSQQKSMAINNPHANNCGDSWDTYESNNHSSRDWNFADNSKYAQSQASAPVVNVWDERIKRSEAIKSMEPTNETEEEAMIRHAIELSKLEAQRDEENQKKLAKEYELQMQLLASNPEMVECVSEALDEHTSISHSTLKNDTILNQESRDFKNEFEPISKNPVYNRNDKNPIYNRNGMKSTDFGGAKPKFSKIIESFGGWGIKENVSVYAKQTSEANDCWDEPNRNSPSDKITQTSSSFEHGMSKSQKKQPKERKNLKKPSYTQSIEDDSFDLKNEKKHSEKNDYQHEEFLGDLKSDFTFFPAKKAESLHSLDEIENDNSPGYTEINHKVSEESVVHDTKTVTEFDDFMQDLKRDSVEVISKTELESSENDVFWEDKKSVQFSDSKWEKNGVNLVVCDSNNDTLNDKSESYDFSSSFNAMTISSNSKPDKYEGQSSYSFSAASNNSNVSTCNTNEFLCSNPNNASDENLLSSDIQNSTGYCDFQANNGRGNEIVAEENDIYNPFTLNMPSVPKQTLLEENACIQSENQTFQLPSNNFVSVDESSTAVHHNPTLNQSSSSFIMPNLSLGTPVMPVAMPLGTFSPAFVSPYANPMIMQQMLMLNNPFFVKQLQVLDMYYRSAGIPCSGIPFAPMQMPLANSPLHDPNLLASQNQVLPENERNISPTFPFSNGNKVPERAGAVPNPPGLNNFMQTKNQIDTLQQAEINSFLDKYCDDDFGDEVPPIPPPKPTTSKCTDSSNLMFKSSASEVISGNYFYNENQKNCDVIPASATFQEDAVSLDVKQNALENEHVGWGDLDDSSVEHQKQYMWDESVDGWGKESATPFVRNTSNVDTRKKSMNRQPSSQPIAGRYKR